MEKGDNVQQQMVNVSRGMETPQLEGATVIKGINSGNTRKRRKEEKKNRRDM